MANPAVRGGVRRGTSPSMAVWRGRPVRSEALAVERPAAAEVNAREQDAYTLGVQAILWGYPLVCTARAAEAAARAGSSQTNVFRRTQRLKTAADRDVAAPNNVTVEAHAWLDLREEPVALHVPALTEPRWCIVQISDTFDEVAANIGGIKGLRPGAYAICGPRFDGKLTGELSKIGLRTTQGSCVVRVFVGGDGDLPGAVAVQNAFQLIPLSAYLREGLAYRPPAGTLLPALADAAPPALRHLDHIGQAMRWYLPSSADSADPLIMAFHRIGLSAARGFDYRALDELTTRGLERAAATAERIIDARWADRAETIKGWRYNAAAGRAGHDFALRAALAKGAPGAEFASEILDLSCRVDAHGGPLNGQSHYQLHFPAGELPPVSAFWNLSLFGEDMRFVDSDAGRYSIGSTTDGLARNPDGSLTLYIQHDRPDDRLAQPNWLPAPHGLFNLMMRLYGPATAVLDGTYQLPAVANQG
jgi:hypothetical protein